MYGKLYFIGFSVIALLFGCAEKRHETPQYFSEKTGIYLCSEAAVKNVKISEYDNETDFIYSVRIWAGQKCTDSFYQSIKDNYKINCQQAKTCEFMNEKSWSYLVVRNGDSSITLTLQAI